MEAYIPISLTSLSSRYVYVCITLLKEGHTPKNFNLSM